MTDTQLYLTIGLPTLAVLVGILANAAYWVAMNGRIQSLETRFGTLEARLEARMSSLEAKFDLLVGKVIEINNRLVRL